VIVRLRLKTPAFSHRHQGTAASAPEAPRIPGRRRLPRWRTKFAVAAITLTAIAGGLTYKHVTDLSRARVSYDTGLSLQATALYDQAMPAFDRAIALNPAFADAYLMRGKSYRAKGEMERAIEDFGQVVKLRPSDPGALLERCSALLEQKDYRAAISDATKALELEPKLGLAYNLRGSAFRGAGDLPRAIQDFDRAIALQPNADNYFQRGETYQLMGDHQRAIADFDEVIAFLPKLPAAYLARSLSRRALGDIQGAEQDRHGVHPRADIGAP
jgi:tetratricopeptide (TPR) repeat protein